MNEAREISRPAPDKRHRLLLCETDQLYREANHGVPIPDAAQFARSLNVFLSANPKWSGIALLVCLRNRFASKNVNHAAAPHTWIALLPLYVHGPLDE